MVRIIAQFRFFFIHLQQEDETKPVCLRCTKGGFECLGYARLRLWHHTSTAPFPDRGGVTVHEGQQTRARALKSPPPELSLIAFQGDICFAFMFSNFVWRAYGTPWLDHAAGGKLGELALNTARALSQANFGQSNLKPDIELQGAILYGKCLRSLALQLEDHTTNTGQDLLIPILLMMMHAVSTLFEY